MGIQPDLTAKMICHGAFPFRLLHSCVWTANEYDEDCSREKEDKRCEFLNKMQQNMMLPAARLPLHRELSPRRHPYNTDKRVRYTPGQSEDFPFGTGLSPATLGIGFNKAFPLLSFAQSRS